MKRHHICERFLPRIYFLGLLIKRSAVNSTTSRKAPHVRSQRILHWKPSMQPRKNDRDAIAAVLHLG